MPVRGHRWCQQRSPLFVVVQVVVILVPPCLGLLHPVGVAVGDDLWQWSFRAIMLTAVSCSGKSVP